MKKQKSPLEIFQRTVLASQEGFEPPTVRLEGECSIQLSYYDRSLTTKFILTDFEITCKYFQKNEITKRPVRINKIMNGIFDVYHSLPETRTENKNLYKNESMSYLYF